MGDDDPRQVDDRQAVDPPRRQEAAPAGAASERDAAAARLGELLDTTVGRLRTIFARYGIAAADAEDILQDSLLSVYQHWQAIRDAEHYFFATVRRRIGILRRQRGAAVMLSLDDEEVERLAPVAAAQEESHRQQDARSLLARLNLRSRQVLHLRYSEQLSMREIAAALATSEAGVRKTASRAVQRLRQYAKALHLGDGAD
jgi:RNA polymerase sigma factor (sigma-70 family)